MEGLEKVIEKADALFFPLALSFVAGFARFMFSDKKSVLSFLRGLTVSSFTGAIVAMALQDMSYGEGYKGAIVGVCAFCADEFLMVMIIVVKNIKRDPIKYAKEYLSKK